MRHSRFAIVTASSVCLAVIVAAYAHCESPKLAVGDSGATTQPGAAKAVLAAEKLKIAQEAWRTATQMHEAGMKDPSNSTRCEWARRLMEAKREAATTAADRLNALKEYVANMKALEKDAQGLERYGGQFEVFNVTYLRIEADQMLAEAERR